jgi:hypothetical protein
MSVAREFSSGSDSIRCFETKTGHPKGLANPLVNHPHFDRYSSHAGLNEGMGTIWSFEEALGGSIRDGEIFKGNELCNLEPVEWLVSSVIDVCISEGYKSVFK